MTSTPPWGTPPGSPEPGPPPLEEQVPGRPGPGRWVVLIEQHTGSGNTMVWRLDPAPFPGGDTRGQARSIALDLARTFRPKHPMSIQGRSVFRVDDDTLVVLVVGATKTFHFRVTVAERVG